MTNEAILAALSNVQEPDLGKDLVTLNMVKDILIEGNNVSFTVVLKNHPDINKETGTWAESAIGKTYKAAGYDHLFALKHLVNGELVDLWYYLIR